MLVEYFLKGSLEQGKGKDPRVKILKFRLQFNNLELIYALWCFEDVNKHTGRNGKPEKIFSQLNKIFLFKENIISQAQYQYQGQKPLFSIVLL